MYWLGACSVKPEAVFGCVADVLAFGFRLTALGCIRYLYRMLKKMMLLLFLFIYKIVPAQLTYQTLFVDYDSAWTYKNLKIIPIRPKARVGKARWRPMWFL